MEVDENGNRNTTVGLNAEASRTANYTDKRSITILGFVLLSLSFLHTEQKKNKQRKRTSPTYFPVLISRPRDALSNRVLRAWCSVEESLSACMHMSEFFLLMVCHFDAVKKNHRRKPWPGEHWHKQADRLDTSINVDDLFCLSTHVSYFAMSRYFCAALHKFRKRTLMSKKRRIIKCSTLTCTSP